MMTVYRQFTVYRMCSATHELLYVGQTADIQTRLKDHQGKNWWPEVVRIDVSHHASRAAAMIEESNAIQTEHPRENLMSRRRNGTGVTKTGLARMTDEQLVDLGLHPATVRLILMSNE